MWVQCQQVLSEKLRAQAPKFSLLCPGDWRENSKGFTFIKEREIAQPDCHERKEPTLVLCSVCAGVFTCIICLGSHPGGREGYPRFRQERIELAKVTQQIVKLGDFFLLKAQDLLTAYDFLLILWPRDGIMYGLRA